MLRSKCKMANILDAQLRLHFSTYDVLDRQTKHRLVCGVLLYLFRGISSVELTYLLKDYLGQKISVLVFRQVLLGTGYVLRNIKGYLYTLVVKGAFTSRKKALPIARNFHVRDEDIILGKYISTCDGLQKLLLCYYNEKGYKCLTFRYFTHALNQIAEGTQEYTAKFVYRKLRFIYQSNGMEAADFTNDFIAKGIQSVLVMYPCVDGRLHALNIAKQAIHNHGINTILKYTSKGRQTLRKELDGCFSSRKISLDLLQSSRLSNGDSYLANGLDGHIEMLDYRSQVNRDKQELEIAVHQLMRVASAKQRKAMHLLMGEYCPRFSHWLHTERNIKMDNVEYYHRLLGRDSLHLFVNNAFIFLGVGPEEGEAFLQKLRNACAD